MYDEDDRKTLQSAHDALKLPWQYLKEGSSDFKASLICSGEAALEKTTLAVRVRPKAPTILLIAGLSKSKSSAVAIHLTDLSPCLCDS